MVRPPVVAEGTIARRLFTTRNTVTVVLALLGILLLANVHLVYVAVTSQPDCVPHLKSADSDATDGSFRAAKSAC